MRVVVLGPEIGDGGKFGVLVDELTRQGHTVVGDDTIQAPAVVVLVDPPQVGVETTRRRALALGSHVPLVVLTQRRDPAALEQLLEVADEVLPVSLSARVLSRHLSRVAAAGSRLRAAIDSSCDAVFLLDTVRDAAGAIADFVCVDVNARGAAMLRLPRDELVGSRLLHLLPECRSDGLFAKLVRVVDTGEPMEQELAITQSAVAAEWLHHQVVKAGDGVAITSRDVTRGRGLERLRETTLGQAAHLAQLGCWSYDPRGDRLVLDPEMGRILGVPPIAPLNLNQLLSHVHPEDRAAAGARISEAIAHPQRVELECRIVRPDGAVRDCRVLASIEANGARWIGTWQDVSEQRGHVGPTPRPMFDDLPAPLFGSDAAGLVKEWGHAAKGSVTVRRAVGEPRGSAPSPALDAAAAKVSALASNVTSEAGGAERYRTLARHMPNGAVLLFDKELCFLLADGSELHALGIDPAQLIGKRLPEVVSPEELGAIEPIYRAALAGRVASGEVVFGGRDYDVTCAPVYDGAGHIAGGMALSQNIGARKRATAAVRQQQERLATVLRLSPALIVGIDRAGRTTFVNPAAQRITGYTESELSGAGLWDTLCEDGEQVAEMLARLRERGSLRDHELRITCKSGERRIVSWSIDGRFVRHGDIVETFAYGVDVTQRNEMQERLIIAERMASVASLAAGVAHEINNPLTYVLHDLRFLEEGLGAAGDLGDLVSLASEARQGAERIARIVRDVQMFSSGEIERTSLIDVRRCLEACLQMARSEVRQRGRVVHDLGDAPLVRGNDARLGQAVLNVLLNAAQALPEGRERENKVRVATLTDLRGRAVIEIADNGPGIDAAVLRRIFDPFFSTKPIGAGSGLGLAIARGIIARMGGEISVESRPGHGTVFRIALPAGTTPSGEPAAGDREAANDSASVWSSRTSPSVL